MGPACLVTRRLVIFECSKNLRIFFLNPARLLSPLSASVLWLHANEWCVNKHLIFQLLKAFRWQLKGTIQQN